MADALMTIEELLAFPVDAIDRWLIRGRLREQPYAPHGRFHSRARTRIGYVLSEWLRKQPISSGEALAGEPGCVRQRNPDTCFGIDLVYISQDVASKRNEFDFVEGAPTLAVDILEPTDKRRFLDEKLTCLQEAGTPLVWIVDPIESVVIVYRADGEPELLNVNQEISADPHLPGFSPPCVKDVRYMNHGIFEIMNAR